MSEWKTLRENELGNKCFHNPEWAHDEIERLNALVDSYREDHSERVQHIQRLQAELKQANADIDFRERERIAIAKIRDKKYTKLRRELKQANAVVEAARRAVEAGCWSTGQTQENVLREALAALKTNGD